MKKFFLLVLLTLFITGSVGALSSKKLGKPSDYKIGIEYEQALKSEKPSILLFYTDWCSYCKKFMPLFKILSDNYSDRYNFVMVNAEENQKLSREYFVSGYPALYVIDPKIDNLIYINSGTYDSKKSIEKEFDRYLKIRERIK